ncbi:MAG: hypothetical protein WKG07_39385 [Hymenobacter sp.]
MMVGASRSGVDLYHFLTVHDPVANQFLGFFADEPAPAEVSHLVLGRLSDIEAYCQREQVDEIYFALPLERNGSQWMSCRASPMTTSSRFASCRTMRARCAKTSTFSTTTTAPS